MAESGTSDIEKQFEFQKKSWVVQRVGWGILLVILIAGALGLLGGIGPFATTSVGDENGPIHLEYDRFAQFLAPTHFHLAVKPTTEDGDTARIWIDRNYVNQYIVQSMNPEPDSQIVATDRIIYEFKLAEAGEPFTVTFEVRYNNAGLHRGRIGLEDGATLEFSQFVYP